MSDGDRTCGEGIAARAVFPALLAELIGSLSQNLELHLTAIDPEAPASRPEYEAYQDLIARQRALEGQLRSLASAMSGYRDLPMAEHDPSAYADPRLQTAFAALVDHERRLASYLATELAADEAMLEGWPAAE